MCRSTKRANKDMEERLRVFEKQVEAQHFVMNNLRNGIDYLKNQCHTDASKLERNFVRSDLTWSDGERKDVYAEICVQGHTYGRGNSFVDTMLGMRQ